VIMAQRWPSLSRAHSAPNLEIKAVAILML